MRIVIIAVVLLLVVGGGAGAYFYMMPKDGEEVAEVEEVEEVKEEVKEEYGYDLISNVGNNYDGVIVAVNHAEYMELDEAYFQSILKSSSGVLFDIKGIYRDKIKSMTYLSL